MLTEQEFKQVDDFLEECSDYFEDYEDDDDYGEDKVETSEAEPRICAECGSIIEPEDTWYKVGDNFLQVKYFDSNEDNCFCSKDCLLRSLFTLEVGPDGDEFTY